MHIRRLFLRHPKRIAIAVLLLLLCILCPVSLYRSAYGLCVTRYTVSADIDTPLRVVQLSDLHGAVFGENNERLLSAVRDTAPDLILVTGDTVNAWEPDVTASTALIAALSEIAPVYVSLGNHEIAHAERFGSDFDAFWGDYAEVLDFSTAVVEINGVRVALGGLYGYCSVHPEDTVDRETAFLDAFSARDADVHLLLAHLPLLWTTDSDHSAAAHWNTLDAVFCGHNHGGQIIWPLLGGTYAPDMGYFPGRVWGLYEKDGAAPIILSRGLGSGTFVPRFNNVPEIVVCDVGVE